MAVVEEPQRVGDEFKSRRADALSLPVNIVATARPVLSGEGRESFFDKAAIEGSMMSDDEDDPPKQIIYGTIVNALAGDHFIGDPGDFRDLRRDRKAGIFEPLPGTKYLIDPSLMRLYSNRLMPSSIILVALRIGACRLDIDDGRDEFWGIVGWVVMGLWL
jgi:hypothetical protein